MTFTVLHTESSKGWGGQESRILHEAIGLRKLGARVIILGQPGSGLTQRAAEHGIETRHVAMRNSFDFAAIRAMLKVIRADRVDVINTHSGRDTLLAGLAGRSEPQQAPYRQNPPPGTADHFPVDLQHPAPQGGDGQQLCARIPAQYGRQARAGGHDPYRHQFRTFSARGTSTPA